MATFTLDQIRAAADKKYGATEIQVDDNTTVELVNPLRLTADKRAELAAAQSRMENADEGDSGAQEQALKDCLRAVCRVDWMADTLLGVIGDDMALLAETFAHYGAEQELGEASASAS